MSMITFVQLHWDINLDLDMKVKEHCVMFFKRKHLERLLLLMMTMLMEALVEDLIVELWDMHT